MTNLGHLAKEDGDREEARTWWNRAADADNTNAMGMLGLLASEDEDRETARTWYTRAAEAGAEGAEERLRELDEG